MANDPILTARRALTVREFLAASGMSKASFYRRMRDNTIATLVIGRRRYVTATELNRLFGREYIEPMQESA